MHWGTLILGDHRAFGVVTTSVPALVRKRPLLKPTRSRAPLVRAGLTPPLRRATAPLARSHRGESEGRQDRDPLHMGQSPLFREFSVSLLHVFHFKSHDHDAERELGQQ
jgi:hypothetical protein